MKTAACVIAGLLICTTSIAQKISVGAKTGVNLSHVLTSDPNYLAGFGPGVMLGATGTYMFSKRIGVQAEVLFNNVVLSQFSDGNFNYYDIGTNNLAIPLMMHCKFGKFTLDAGTQLSFLLTAKAKNYSEGLASDMITRADLFPVNFSVLFGGGLEFPMGLFTGVRLNLSTSGVFADAAYGTPYYGYEYRALVLQLAVGYNFLKAKED